LVAAGFSLRFNMGPGVNFALLHRLEACATKIITKDSMSSKPQPDFHDKIINSEPRLPAVVERELWVENRLGLHARPVAKITALAQSFDAEITLEKDGEVADARDLLAILALDCPQGTRLVLKATGPQAREAAMTIASLFARKFGET